MVSLSDDVMDFISGVEEYSEEDLKVFEKAIEEEQIRRYEREKMKNCIRRKK